MSGRRRFYLRPAGRWVGFGRNAQPDQPDVVEREYRIGWRLLSICRACLLSERERLAQENARISDLARRASSNVVEGMRAIDVEIARRLGGGGGQ